MHTTPLHTRIRCGHPTKDGRPGLYYLRLRLRSGRGLYKARAYDLPLETTCYAEAERRAALLVRSFIRAGAEVMGDLTDLSALSLPAYHRRPEGKRRRRTQDHHTPTHPGLS